MLFMKSGEFVCWSRCALAWASGSSPHSCCLDRETERLWENWFITKTAFPSPRWDEVTTHHFLWCEQHKKLISHWTHGECSQRNGAPWGVRNGLANTMVMGLMMWMLPSSILHMHMFSLCQRGVSKCSRGNEPIFPQPLCLSLITPLSKEPEAHVMNELFMMEFINSRSKSCEFPLRLFHPMWKTGVQTSNAE